MREIKFRAYGGDKGMIYSDSFDRGIFAFFPYIEDQFYFDNEGPKDYVLMRYVGLKDKNGKEIYEGDILKVIGGGWSHWTGQKFRVYYCDDTGKFNITNDKSYPHDIIDSIAYKYLEIIGNIHENPNLLQ